MTVHGEEQRPLPRTRPRPLSPEMRELLAALRAKPDGQLPGLEVGPTVEFAGGRWWRIAGARRCWQTETVLALLRRGLIERAKPCTYRARGAA
jgi:hypothetical protein